MVNKSKAKGTNAETAVVNKCHEYGFPLAERLALKGNKDVGDVRVAHGIHLEIKAGKVAEHPSEGQVKTWRAEAATEATNAGPGHRCYLVTKRARTGDAYRWSVHLTCGEYADLTKVPCPPHIRDHPLNIQLGSLLTILNPQAGLINAQRKGMR